MSYHFKFVNTNAAKIPRFKVSTEWILNEQLHGFVQIYLLVRIQFINGFRKLPRLRDFHVSSKVVGRYISIEHLALREQDIFDKAVG